MKEHETQKNTAMVKILSQSEENASSDEKNAH